MMYCSGTKGVLTKVVDLKDHFRHANANNKPLETTSSLSGGIISDLDLAWSFSGPILKVYNVAEGTIQSSWDFSSVTRDSRTQIRCVIEYPVSENSRLPTKENQICLIVGYTSKKDASKSSFISFCHPRTSRILHTVTTREKVTCLSLLSVKKDHANPFSGVLKVMSGALAVGTQSGNLLILDMKDIFNYCRRNSSDTLRNRYSEMLILDLKRMSENEIKDRICKLDDPSCHIAVLMSDKKDSRDPDVEICALTYIPESTCLAVGLKNGSFQLWDINTLKKLYKSTTLEVHTPVVGFGFQEPCNDPQNFCYLWVLYESESKNETCLPFAVMYGILYKKVTTIPTYGRHYRNFVHCKKRFDLDMDLDRCVNGRCITSSVVSNTPSNILRHAGTNEEDASKINLFVMIFETWEHNADVNSSISIVVFDMNQWYKAQMPHQCYLGYAVPFVNFMLLERVSEKKGCILDVRIKKDTIQQFLSFNLSEEYSYPSSLSFDTVFLAGSKIINVRIPGAQRSVLERIISDGPIGLVNPSKYYTECKEAGLRPCFLDSFSNTIVPSQIQQRNYILTILLENKISSFLVRCVKDWADGSRGVSGCTLPNLIQWAWDCITRIKLTTDVICIPLFDYSGDDLDRENYQKLKHCVQLIHVIRDLLVYVFKNFKQFLLDDVKLKQQVDSLQLVTKYFDAIIWCLDCGLLPEKVAGSTDKCVPIYIVNILQNTEQRREELKRIGLNDKYFLIENAPPLIVDAILDREPKGKKLQFQWQRESGGLTYGLYPPVTLQSLLRMFLLPDLSADVKHFIMLYFLFDVCDYHRDEEMKEQLLSFSVIFSLDTAYFSLVQACWLLDHEKFEEAVDILTVDAVVSQLRQQPLLYKTILQVCVCQKQYGVALKLERLVKLTGIVFPDDRFYVTLLLQNGLVMEAYTTLKKVSFGQKELMRHFFKVCDDFGLLKEIFKFPISSTEENVFMSYLDESPSRDAGDLKIMYLLSRGRYVEAVDFNHDLASVVPKFDVVGRETAKQNSKTGRVTTRDLLVRAFSKTLPSVTNELISFCRKEKDKIYRFKEVKKPTPLSVIVHTDTTQQVPTYKSSFENILQAAITKTAETWSSFPKLAKRKNFNSSIVKDTPFLRSDIMTPRKDTSEFFREKSRTTPSKCDVDEPPAKRRRSELNLDWANETDPGESLASPSVEVTKILTTPHVQKRLNKLLQNTPESSPLPSILKSSEISRFKQPQKVGFNFPHSNKPTSHKVAVIAETPIVSLKSALRRSLSPSAVKKVITDEFSSPLQKRVDVIVENVAVTQQAKAYSPRNDSLDTSTNADSYYSLESDTEINDFEADEAQTKSPAIVAANVSHQQTFIESMSEDEVAETSKRIVMEVMSEEESAAENQSRQIVVDVHVEPAPLTPPADVPQTRDSQPIFELPEIPEELEVEDEPEVEEEPQVEEEPKDEPETELSDAVVIEQPLFGDDEELNEMSSQVPEFPIQISSTFSVSSGAVSGRFEAGEIVSFATMQPVAAEPKQSETQPRTAPSWDRIYEEYRAGSAYSDQLEVDTEQDNGAEFKEEANQEGTGNASCTTEDDRESVTDEEALNSSFQSQPNNSVTEIQDSSAEDDDSDIEILEDESTIAPPRKVDEKSDLSAEDDISENSYESDYSYSQESAEVESNEEENSVGDAEDNSVADAEEVAEESEAEIVCGEAQEVEDEFEEEYEEEATDNDGEDEYEEEAEEEEEEEREEERLPVREENSVSVDQCEVPAAISFDAEILCRDNPMINYEELKQIVSNVAAVEDKTEEVASSEFEETKKVDSSVAAASFSYSQDEMSVCEVYDSTQSVVEETVNLDFSDTVPKIEISSYDSLCNVSVIPTEKTTESVDESQKPETSVEVLSLSTVAKEELSEPPMVFFFGENSVTSISEEMLIEGTSKSFASQRSQVEANKADATNVEDSNQVADADSIAMEVEEAYTSQNLAQQESVYVVDIDSEFSIEEGLAKNRSLLDESAISGVERLSTIPQDVPKLPRADIESAPLFVSTPVSKDTCIRMTAAVHKPKDIFSAEKSEEPVCTKISSTSEERTSASNAPPVDEEPRISVITGTMSPKTSPKRTTFASAGSLSTETVSEPAVSTISTASMIFAAPTISASSDLSDHEPNAATPTLLQSSRTDRTAGEAGQQILHLQSISVEDASSSIVELSPVSPAAVHSPSLDEQIIGTATGLSSPSKSTAEVSQLAHAQMSSHSSSPTSVKTSPKPLMEGAIPGHSPPCSTSSVTGPESSGTLATVEVMQADATEQSEVPVESSPGFESDPGHEDDDNQSISQQHSSPSSSSVVDAKSSPLKESTTEAANAAEPSSPFSTTSLVSSQSSPAKSVIDERYQRSRGVSSPSKTFVLSSNEASDESSQSSNTPQQSSQSTTAAVGSPCEENIHDDNQSDYIEEYSSSNSPAVIPQELSYDQTQTFSTITKPLVAYTPSPTRLSFSETIRRSLPTEDISVTQQSQSEVISISKSNSPRISTRSSTPTLVTSSQVSQSSPVAVHDLRTPEKGRSSQSSVQVLSTPRNSSVTSSPQTVLVSSSPETFDATYDSHIGVLRRGRGSASSSRVSSPSSSVKISDDTPLQHEAKLHSSDVEEDGNSVKSVPPSPRRSVRLSRRLSTDSTTLDAVPEEEPESTRSPARRKSTRRSLDHAMAADVAPVSAATTDEGDIDDAASVKSAASAASTTKSVSSRASTSSNRSQTRKRSSFTRLEMRKSSVRPSFRPLQVIKSDEEMESPTKSEVGSEPQNILVERKYASSEPGDVSSGSRRSKRSRASSLASDEDDRFSTASEKPSKKIRKRSTKSQSDKNLLNSGMIATPTPQKGKSRKLVSSTPMKQEQIAPTTSTAAVSDYTMSRRLTRFQKNLLEGGIRRGEQSGENHDAERMRAKVAELEEVPEETESVDSQRDFPEGSLRLEMLDGDEGEAESTTRAVRNRTIKTRASDVRASRGGGAVGRRSTRGAGDADDGSSDGSVGSRASTSSRRRKARPSTFTKMELRRSSARPQFQPLSVIASDEESPAFQTPPRPPHEDESLLSSSESAQSRRSRRSAAGAGTARSRRAGSEHSEHDTSSVSDVSTVSTATRRSARSLAAEVAAAAPSKEVRAQPKTKQPIKEIPKKRKRT